MKPPKAMVPKPILIAPFELKEFNSKSWVLPFFSVRITNIPPVRNQRVQASNCNLHHMNITAHTGPACGCGTLPNFSYQLALSPPGSLGHSELRR